MKFIKADKDKFSFQMEPDEKRLLFQVLSLYPLIPIAHHQLSKSSDRPEDQKLLEDALSVQRLENKKQVKTMLTAKSRFRPNKMGFQFSLKAAQLEWLLQVLNDVRVGAWLNIGSPDGHAETFAALNENTAPFFWAMEVAGHFQSVLLKATVGGADQ